MDDGGEFILLHLRSGGLYTCGEVGALVWRSLEKPATLQSLLDKICEEFEAEEAVARADLERFVEDMIAEKLVTRERTDHG